MSRTDKMGLFASVAAVALMFGSAPVSAQGTPIGAIDNLAPAAPENFRVDNIDDVDRVVTLQWDLSASDAITATSTGNYADASGATVAGNNVTGYIITRTATGEETVTYTVAAGVWELVDDDNLTPGVSYTYTLAVTDGTNTAENDEPLSDVSVGAPPEASLSVVDGEDIDFLTVAGDEEAGQQIVIDNLATEAEAILDVTIAVTGLGFSTSDVSLVVDPDDEAEFTVSFSATAAGNIDGLYEGTLVIRTNDPDHLETVVTLQATIDGADAAAILDVVGNAMTFVNVLVNESRTQALTIQNLGTLNATADLVLSGDDVFAIGLTTVNVSAGGTASVDVTFSPNVDRQDFSGLITITSAQAPATVITFVLAGAAGEVDQDNPVKVQVIEVVATFPTSVSAAVLDDPDQRAALEASLISGLLAALDDPNLTAERIIIKSITISSTIVTYQILDPPADDVGAPSADAVATALEDLVTTAPADFSAAFDDEGLDLGTVDTIVSAPVVVTIQPIDPSGASVVAWFTRTGTRVDFDDFAKFAAAFGTRLGDDAYDDILDISSSADPGVADGRIDFADFSRFADDFGKTVANAADIQAFTLGG